MNKYIVWGMVLFLTGAYASENPFSVKKHSQQLDQEQNNLLSELKAVSIRLEEAEDAQEDEDEEEEALAQEEAVVATTTRISEKNETAPTETAVKEEETRLKKVKEDQLRLEEAREKQEKEKLALEKLASETLAAEKVAMAKEEAEEEAKKVEEKRIAEELEKLEAEKAKLEKKLTEEAEAMKEVDAAKKSTPIPSTEKKPSPQAVKTTVSKDPEAKQMADEAYKEALEEVDKEN